MHELAHDERMRHLQRLAYGAVASDAERAAAVAELESLRQEREAERADAASDASAQGAPLPTTPTLAPISAAAVTTGDAGAEASARRFRWAIAAGTAALLLGIAVGWQLGTRVATASAPIAAEQSVASLEDAQLMVPVADTAVPRLFDAEPTPADVPAVPLLDERITPTDYRLLVTRPDGVALHVARVDGEVCAVVVHPGWGTASGCTTEGRFPETGLWVQAHGQGSQIRGTIHPDGTAALTPASYLPDGLPTDAG